MSSMGDAWPDDGMDGVAWSFYNLAAFWNRDE